MKTQSKEAIKTYYIAQGTTANMNHFVLCLKLIQYCKSTVLQFKKKTMHCQKINSKTFVILWKYNDNKTTMQCFRQINLSIAQPD